MREFWIMTVADPWCDLLLRSFKSMELRKRVPNLRVGDVIFVCRKGGGTSIVGAFRLMDLYCYGLSCLSRREKVCQHRLSADEVEKYANGSSHLFGLSLLRIRFDESIKVEDFGYTRNPQGFYRIRVDFWHNIPKVVMKGEGGGR